MVAQSVESVLEPALSKLLKAAGSIDQFHSKDVLTDHRVHVARLVNPIEIDVAQVAGGGAHRECLDPARAVVVRDGVVG